jgi:hypothetical protein
MKSLTQQIEAEARAIRGMKQYKAALDDGRLTQADIDTMAMERVQRRRANSTDAPTALPALELFNAYGVDAGQPLLGISMLADDDDPNTELPSLVHWSEPIPGLTDDPSALPTRVYNVFIDRANGRPRGLYIDLNWNSA